MRKWRAKRVCSCRNEFLFENDYNTGCHPRILAALSKTNDERTTGYGLDRYSDEARGLIKDACRTPTADVHFLVGGTQVNLIVAAGALKPWQGVISAETGHVNVHEAGAVEATGHKVLVVESQDGLLSADAIDRYSPIVSRRPDGGAYGAAGDDLSLADNGAWNGLPP